MRKTRITASLVSFCLVASISTFRTAAHRGSSGSTPGPVSAAAPGEVIVKLKQRGALSDAADGAARLSKISQSMDVVAHEVGARVAEPIMRSEWAAKIGDAVAARGLDRLFVLKFDRDSDVASLVARLGARDDVEYAEPNYLLTPAGGAMGRRISLADDPALPNDPDFDHQWSMRNPGFLVDGLGATEGADIGAVAAWTLTTGDPNLVIALIDSGVDITHPDLSPNIYTKPAGKQDGFTGDIHGYNVADDNNDVSDIVGHGTQMAGIIASVLNNEVGVSGICQSKIMPVRISTRTGPDPIDVSFGTVGDGAKGILYAIAAGAQIINASWSTMLLPQDATPKEAQALADAVKASNDAGVLFVTVAGNGGFNNDLSAVYPGHYGLANEIVVAASDFNDEIWHLTGLPQAVFSGFGPATVHIAAPGVSMFTTAARGDCGPQCSDSTDPDDWYTFYTDNGQNANPFSGTSYSAALVSGVAALVKTMYPEATPEVIRRRIMAGADQKDSLRPYVINGNRLNAYGALTAQLNVTPPVIHKIKLKGGNKVLVYGDSFQFGATVTVAGLRYLTQPRSDEPTPLLAIIPGDVFPSGQPVALTLTNPDGGLSQTFMVTR